MVGAAFLRLEQKRVEMTWTSPALSLGFIVALVVAILAALLWGLGQIPKEWAMAIIAVCAVRL